MKIKSSNWPTLLRDGGWRERRQSGEYWPQYIRRHKGREQVIFRDRYYSMWQLRVRRQVVGKGTLSGVLIRADSVAT